MLRELSSLHRFSNFELFLLQGQTGIMAEPEIVSCDDTAWIDEVFTCTVAGYGANYSMQIDWGDGLPISTFQAPGELIIDLYY